MLIKKYLFEYSALKLCNGNNEIYYTSRKYVLFVTFFNYL